jgi:predicted  nucleic acid-binding Zn-ribbon protein
MIDINIIIFKEGDGMSEIVKAVLAKDKDDTTLFVYPKTSSDMVDYTDTQTIKEKIVSIDDLVNSNKSDIGNLQKSVSKNITNIDANATELKNARTGYYPTAKPESYNNLTDRLKSDFDNINTSITSINTTVNETKSTATATQSEVKSARTAVSDGKEKTTLKARIDADYSVLNTAVNAAQSEVESARTARSDSNTKSTLKARIDADYDALNTAVSTASSLATTANKKANEAYSKAETAESTTSDIVSNKLEPINEKITEIEESIPTKVSELTNDSEYATETYVANKVSAAINGMDDDADNKYLAITNAEETYLTKEDAKNYVRTEDLNDLIEKYLKNNGYISATEIK